MIPLGMFWIAAGLYCRLLGNIILGAFTFGAGIVCFALWAAKRNIKS